MLYIVCGDGRWGLAPWHNSILFGNSQRVIENNWRNDDFDFTASSFSKIFLQIQFDLYLIIPTTAILFGLKLLQKLSSAIYDCFQG
jgi:hypothetical protein